MDIKRRIPKIVLLCAVFALTLGVATATAGSNPQKKLCAKGGWQMVYGIDDPTFVPTFTGQQDCVSFTTHGTLMVRFGSLIDCANLGGTYETDPNLPLWR